MKNDKFYNIATQYYLHSAGKKSLLVISSDYIKIIILVFQIISLICVYCYHTYFSYHITPEGGWSDLRKHGGNQLISSGTEIPPEVISL